MKVCHAPSLLPSAQHLELSTLCLRLDVFSVVLFVSINLFRVLSRAPAIANGATTHYTRTKIRPGQTPLLLVLSAEQQPVTSITRVHLELNLQLSDLLPPRETRAGIPPPCQNDVHARASSRLDFSCGPVKLLGNSHRSITSNMKVAVVGAGFSGVQAARALQTRGIECSVFEARYGPGGVWLKTSHGQGAQGT